MKKPLIITALLVAIAIAALWPQRLELILRAAVAYDHFKRPIAENRQVHWQRGAADQQGSGKPNIILILADDLGFNDISFYNGALSTGGLETAAIDALGRDGVAFDNAYAGSAVCAPSRAMLMTGRHSTRFGFEYTPTPSAMGPMVDLMFRNSQDEHIPVINRERLRELPAFEDQGMPTTEITVGQLLQQKGYHTVHIGKWHLGRHGGMRPEQRGFDESLLMESGLYLPVKHPDVVNARQDFDPIDRTLWLQMRYAVSYNGSPPFQPQGYLTDYFTEQAIAAIEANQHRPFFLYLAHWGVHNPLQALKSDYDALSHIKDHRLRVYTAMIKSMDRSVAQIMGRLEELGLADNTLVIFSSDNGGAHYLGLPDINYPYRGWKLTFFEGGVHVPLLMRWPQQLTAGERFKHPVSHLDIFSTIAAAADAAVPDDRVIDGVNLLPYLTEARDAAPRQTIIWRQGYYQAIRSGDWKMMVSRQPDKVWLYDLASDPLERRNIAEERQDKVIALQQQLDAHNAEQAESLWPSVVDLPVLIDKTMAQPYTAGDEYIYWPN